MPGPNVQHNFDGEQGVLDATFNKRLEIRKSLLGLHQDLKKTEASPIQVFAEVKIRIPGAITATHRASENTAETNPFATSAQTDGRRESSVQEVEPPPAGTSTEANSTSTNILDGERPSKRARIGDGPFVNNQPQGPELGAVLKHVANALRADKSTHQVGDLFDYQREWHDRWAQQGSWLYDTVAKLFNSLNDIRANVPGPAKHPGPTFAPPPVLASASAPSSLNIERTFAAVQQTLGQAINASNASLHAELGKVLRLVPWLEECRKAAADRFQEREEQWRLTSANFHDNTRRGRETAEMRMMERSQMQQAMMDMQWDVLKKLARANEIEVDEGNGHPGRGREEGLGDQLRRELTEEAGRDRRQSGPGAREVSIKVDDGP